MPFELQESVSPHQTECHPRMCRIRSQNGIRGRRGGVNERRRSEAAPGAVDRREMRTLRIDEARDPPTTEARRPEPTPEQRRQGNRVFAVYSIVLGLGLQWFLPTTTLRCQSRSTTTAACVVDERMLLGLVPKTTADVAGVRGARTVVHKGFRPNQEGHTYRVVLDTTAGEQEITWSKSFETAYDLATSINEGLRAGAPFEASLGFAFFDWAYRAFALFALAAGAVFAWMGLAGYRRSSATQP
jgi:hypothetical protein